MDLIHNWCTLQPGEFVMSSSKLTFGVDTMMGMNSMGGGNNTPRMAKGSECWCSGKRWWWYGW